MELRTKRIIVSDDDPPFLIQLCGLLNRMGLSTIPAENGAEVLKLVNILIPDLFLMDVMPNLDGLETIKRLKGNPSTQKVPIIAMSSDADDKVAETVKKSGAHDFLPKPIEIKRLHQLLEKVLTDHSRSKRDYIRTPYRGRVVISGDGMEKSYYSETISERGIYVVSPEPLPVGTNVTVTIPFWAETITFKGRVIYHYGLKDENAIFPPGMAIEFWQGSKDNFEMLDELIKEQLTQDLQDFIKDSFK